MDLDGRSGNREELPEGLASTGCRPDCKIRGYQLVASSTARIAAAAFCLACQTIVPPIRIQPPVDQALRNRSCSITSRRREGRALHALLQQVLGAEACSPIITGSITQARAEFDRYQCVSGHLFFHPLVDVSDIWTVTVLRHPIRRLLSHLSYSRYDIVSTGDKFNQRARALDLETYVASDDPDVVRTISDTMIAHFAPLAWDGVEPLTPDRSLALAKEALERFNLWASRSG